MKIAVFSTIALVALCGLALADLYDDDYSSYGSWGGYGGGFGGGFGGGVSSYGGAGYGGGKQYIPIPMPIGGKKGGSGFESLFPLLFLLILLPMFFNNRAVPQDQVILLNSTLRSVGK